MTENDLEMIAKASSERVHNANLAQRAAANQDRNGWKNWSKKFLLRAGGFVVVSMIVGLCFDRFATDSPTSLDMPASRKKMPFNPDFRTVALRGGLEIDVPKDMLILNENEKHLMEKSMRSISDLVGTDLTQGFRSIFAGTSEDSTETSISIDIRTPALIPQDVAASATSSDLAAMNEKMKSLMPTSLAASGFGMESFEDAVKTTFAGKPAVYFSVVRVGKDEKFVTRVYMVFTNTSTFRVGFDYKEKAEAVALPVITRSIASAWIDDNPTSPSEPALATTPYR